ncbi:MAG: UxaA family hydrolase [Lachnospiraceae bacterium]|nr:UxaA family hydrolase [Lachnospiraceae bacterium]
MRNAMIINEKDNVVVAVEPIARGAAVFCNNLGKEESLIACDSIPIYHKIARRNIKSGEKLIKYGEYIGEAAVDIPAGSHVHTHNVLSIREKVRD